LQTQSAICALYDKQFKCVYVGQAGKGEEKGLYLRLKDHAVNDNLFCRWQRFSWYGLYSVKSLEKGDYDTEYKFNTNINDIMTVIESLIIRVNQPKLNLASGSLHGADWFYQEAEFEEQAAKYEQLKKICISMNNK